MQNNTFETLIGAVVVVVATVFLVYAYHSTGSTGASGYEVTARFANVDGINAGTDIRLRGIKVGTVSSLALDPKTYMAIAKLQLRNDVQVPEDSSVKITSSGLLGGSYLSLSPGGSDEMLAAGGELFDTQGSVDLMGLVGRFINSGSGSESSASKAPAQTAPAPQTPVP